MFVFYAFHTNDTHFTRNCYPTTCQTAQQPISPMIEAYTHLKESVGFAELDREFSGLSGAIQRKLFKDYCLTFVPDEGDWRISQNILVYLNSLRFTQVMHALFSDGSGEYNYAATAHMYLPRKFRKDRTGVLAFGMGIYSKTTEHGQLFNGGVEYTLPDIVALCEHMSSPENLFQRLYYSKLNDFIAITEGIWVYLYLCHEIGLSSAEAIKKMETDRPCLHCAMKKDLDAEMLAAFDRVYQKVCADG